MTGAYTSVSMKGDSLDEIAVKWWEKAAKQGVKEAQQMLDRMHQDGGPQSNAKWYEWYAVADHPDMWPTLMPRPYTHLGVWGNRLCIYEHNRKGVCEKCQELPGGPGAWSG